MAHFAKVENGIVTQVIVAEQDVINSGLFGDPSSWIQTSYNTRRGIHTNGGMPLRKNFAGIGYTYDATRDAFIAKKPFNSWILNEEACDWDAPVPMPQDGKIYYWEEASTSWAEFGTTNVVEEAPAEVVVPEVMEETVIAAEESPTEVVVDGGVETITINSTEPTISLDLGTGSDTVTGSATPTI